MMMFHRSSGQRQIVGNAFTFRFVRAILASFPCILHGATIGQTKGSEIVSKRKRGQETLYDWQERWNRLVSRLRARVEHPLGMMKQQLGYRRVRYRGLHRNEFDFFITAAVANIKRSLHLADC